MRRSAPLIENIGDAIRQRARLTATRTCKNQERTINSLDRFSLLFIQRLQFKQWITSFVPAYKMLNADLSRRPNFVRALY